jgi:hypothetical protein
MRTRRTLNLSRFLWGIAVLVVSLACISAGEHADIRSLVSTGKLEGMLWPNFSDYRNGVQKFYEWSTFMEAYKQKPSDCSLVLCGPIFHFFRRSHLTGDS